MPVLTQLDAVLLLLEPCAVAGVKDTKHGQVESPSFQALFPLGLRLVRWRRLRAGRNAICLTLPGIHQNERASTTSHKRNSPQNMIVSLFGDFRSAQLSQAVTGAL